MKKFNITPDKCRFVINKENKTVICILDKTADMFIKFANDNFILSPWLFNSSVALDRIYCKFKMPNRFFGMAKCSEDDEWNEEIGKSVAFSRMKDKLNRSFFKRCNTYVNLMDIFIDNAVNIINQVGEKLSLNMQKRHAYINKLVGEETEDVMQEN